MFGSPPYLEFDLVKLALEGGNMVLAPILEHMAHDLCPTVPKLAFLHEFVDNFRPELIEADQYLVIFC